MRTPTIPIFIIEENIAKTKEKLKAQSKKISARKLTWKSRIIKSFRLFCRKTQVQGFSYILKARNSKVEQYGWITVIVLIFISNIVLLHLAYIWDADTPTITVISKPFYPVWTIPFPAVTICQMNLVSKKKIKKLLKTLSFPQNLSMPTDVIIDQIRNVLYYSNTEPNEDEYKAVSALMIHNNLTIADIKPYIAPDCEEMIVYCKWKGEVKLCDTLFHKINTSEGICCSFNYHAEREENFSEKVRSEITELPKKVSGSHMKVGLSVVLDTQVNDYVATYFSSYGFRVFLHDSYDYADENAEIKMVGTNESKFLRVVPEQVKASPAIRSVPIEKRKCYFRDEYKLNVFANYSYVNCLAECRATQLYEACGCIPMRYASNGSAPICNFDKIPCVIKYRKNFIDNYLSSSRKAVNTTITSKCSYCLPSCELNIYQVDLSASHLHVEYAHSNRYNIRRGGDQNVSILHIFYGDLYTNLYVTDLFVDWISTLATLGGIVGLLSNVNLIAAFEFVFYVLLNPFCHIFDYETDSDADDDS